MRLQTEIYNTPPSAYIKEIMLRWFARNIWWFVALFGICLILSYTVDTAFLLVGCMMIFIIIPMVMTFVYFTYGLRPQSGKWFLPRQLNVSDSGLNIHYEPDERFKMLPPDEFLPFDKISSIKIGEENDVIYIGRDYDHFIIVSIEAFSQQSGQREQFHEYIYQSIQRNLLTSRHEI